MADIREDLGALSDVAAALKVAQVAGRDLIDVGCGAGDNAEALRAAGARVLALEPDPVQAEKNRRRTPPDGLTFVEGRAEALPVGEASVDGVLFFRSLHHVPMAAMEAALIEAARVLKPDGFLIVVEPSIDCGYYALTRLYHEETNERLAAQSALARAAAPRFRELAKFRSVHFPRYANFDALVARALGQTYNALARTKVERDEVRAVFEAGRTATGDYQFEQPMLIDLYRGPLVH